MAVNGTSNNLQHVPGLLIIKQRGQIFCGSMVAQSCTRIGLSKIIVNRMACMRSPRRGETFVTRKITRAFGAIKAGVQSELSLEQITLHHILPYCRQICMKHEQVVCVRVHFFLFYAV